MPYSSWISLQDLLTGYISWIFSTVITTTTAAAAAAAAADDDDDDASATTTSTVSSKTFWLKHINIRRTF